MRDISRGGVEAGVDRAVKFDGSDLRDMSSLRHHEETSATPPTTTTSASTGSVRSWDGRNHPVPVQTGPDRACT